MDVNNRPCEPDTEPTFIMHADEVPPSYATFDLSDTGNRFDTNFDLAARLVSPKGTDVNVVHYCIDSISLSLDECSAGCSVCIYGFSVCYIDRFQFS